MTLQKIILAAVLATLPFMAQAKLNVVATIPDFGSIAEKIGGENVNIAVIARGTEDPHFVDARPSFIRVLNRADVLLETGAELEIGWLPPLLASARNAKILPDSAGHVKLSEGIQMLDIPASVDRSMGDVHPLGNPHYWLNPENEKIIARHIAKVFGGLDSKNGAAYAANLKKFESELEQKLKGWKEMMEPYRKTKVVTYHKSFDYFLHYFGLEPVGELEPRPGLEPSPTHLKGLIPRMKAEEVKLILIEPNRPRKTPEYVARETGAKLVIIPQMTGGNEKVKDCFALFDYNVAQIIEALKK